MTQDEGAGGLEEAFEEQEADREAQAVAGRSRWFTQRVERPELGRLISALGQAAGLPDAGRRPARAIEDGLRVFGAALDVAPEDLREPMLLDGRGERLRVSYVDDEPRAGRIGPGVSVAEVPERAFLVVPLEHDASHGAVDLSTTALLRRREDGGYEIVEGAGVTADARLAVAELVRPGRYELYARPTDPWLIAVLRAADAHWAWIAAEARVLGEEALGRLPGRICELILCAPDWRQAGSDALGRGGLGPPGPWPGVGGDICDDCFGALMPIDIGGGVLDKPPLVQLVPKWWPRSCGWRALGPSADIGFAGIGRVSQLAVHPADPAQVLAAAAGGGVWRTRDGGISWTALMSDQPTLTMGAVAYAPSDPASIYAASGEDGGPFGAAWPGAGVYRSTDAGATWTLTTRVPSDRFSAIAVHPTDPAVVYVAGNRGLHKTRDGGRTWVANPGQSSLLDGPTTDVVIAHDDPDRVYVGVQNSGVWRSTSAGEAAGGVGAFARLDGPGQLPAGAGAAWIKLAIGRAGANGSGFLLAKLGADGGRLFRTVDGGQSWIELAGGIATVAYDEWCSIVAVRPDDEGTILVGTRDLARTTNGGATAASWAAVGGIHADQQDLVFSESGPAVGYLANDGGVYRTADGGATWTFRSGGLQVTQFYDMSASPGADVVAGGAQDDGIYYRNGVGQWRNLPWGDGTGVAVDPTDSRIFYFSSQNGVATWTDPAGGVHIGLARSTDGGLTMQELGRAGLSGGSPFVTLLKLDPSTPIANPATSRTLFACGTNVLFRSTNGGQSWQRVQAPGGAAFTTIGEITALEFAPSNPAVLYLGTSFGHVYRAVAGGAAAGNWTLLSPAGSPNEALFPDVPIQSITVDPSDPNHLWVAFTGPGVTFSDRWGVSNPLGASHVYRSTDGGATWQDASGRFPGLGLPDIATSAVAFHPTTRGAVYVGTDAGVFRTLDEGTTWITYSEALPRSPVTDLAAGGDRLLAATMGRGMHVRDI